MCLTIPKKVISKKEHTYVVEKKSGETQEVKSIVNINIGDFVVTQNNVIIQKLSKKQAHEINSLLNQ